VYWTFLVCVLQKGAKRDLLLVVCTRCIDETLKVTRLGKSSRSQFSLSGSGERLVWLANFDQRRAHRRVVYRAKRSWWLERLHESAAMHSDT
jgi:hypothetical protein